MVIKPKILIVVLVLIIIAGVVIAIQQKSPGETVKDGLTLCVESGMDKDECLIEEAIVGGNPSLCDDIKGEERLKFECYAEMAIELKDTEFCKKITRKIEYNIGKNVLTISEDECYWLYSLAHGTTEVCSMVVDEDIRSACEEGREPPPIL